MSSWYMSTPLEGVDNIKEACRSRQEYDSVMLALRTGSGVTIHNNKPLLDAVTDYIDRGRQERRTCNAF